MSDSGTSSTTVPASRPSTTGGGALRGLPRGFPAGSFTRASVAILVERRVGSRVIPSSNAMRQHGQCPRGRGRPKPHADEARHGPWNAFLESRERRLPLTPRVYG